MELQNTARLFGLGLIVLLTLNTSCYNNKQEIPPPTDPDVQVSYSNEMQPFFDLKCVGCHTAGTGIPLTLDAPVSYDNLINGNYVDTLNPSSSLLYTKIIPGGSMESYASQSERELTLNWITQGAKNN